jgi:predicted dehydrogenase
MPSRSPFRIALAGLTHGHVKTYYRSPRTDIELVGVSEPDAALRTAYKTEHGLPDSMFFADIGEMLDRTNPEAVAAFGSIYQHLEVVEAAAPRGVHVMVEKPLAVSVAHAARMAELARKHGIRLLTNYETTWYATTHRAIAMVTDEDRIGAVRKIVIHDGHRGPQEIGCSPAFLGWLTDPVQNGAGALVDFGCYGANLMTRLMGRAPSKVTGFTRQFKPERYPKVDDDSTIIVDYPGAQGVIQGSWNWSVSRKDMELYGERGYIIAADGSTLKTRTGDKEDEQVAHLPPRPSPNNDPFMHLASVVRGETKLGNNDLAELDNNLIVVRILELAKRSAQAGRTLDWEEAQRRLS